MKQLQHTPEGVRDIYNIECGKKLSLESRLHKVLQMYGYRDIQPPTFEFFDVFREEIGTIPSKELYKFFDKEGNTLVLRPDFTPSVARAAATLFPDNGMPVRLCYTGNTFLNYTGSYQGRMREATQMGAELIGVDSVEADAEMLAMVVDGREVLIQAKNIAPNSKAVKAVRRLERIYDILKVYGMEEHVSFDFSMSGLYGYYTGIIFRGYTHGTGDAIVKGGRYDHLLEKFGRKSPSIGFALVIDQLMNALTRQHIRISYARKNTLILYDEGKQKNAIKLARDFREKCKNTELVRRLPSKSLEDYMEYGKGNYAGNLIYIQDNHQIVMINLVTGERKLIN